MSRHRTTETREEAEQTGRSGSPLKSLFLFGIGFVGGYLVARRRRSGGEMPDAGAVSQRLGAGGGTEVAGPGGGPSIPESEAATGETLPTGASEAEDAAESPERERELAFTADDVPRAHGMPMLGLGTWENTDHGQCVRSVATALDTGYRHVDTAQGYDNEDAVGNGLAESTVDREEVFVATKVWNENLAYDNVLESTEESMQKLGVDALDLLYVHWPAGEYDPVDTLDAFAELREEGKIEHIGVSNFRIEDLEEALDVSDVPIFANQVEMHPLLQQPDLREFCQERDIEVVAYSPLARGNVSDVRELREIADKHDATPEQVSLAWLREKEVTAVPKATSEDHIRTNFASLGVELDAEDIEKIDAIDREQRQVDPEFAPWN